jgi:hypothetical protein
MGMLFRRVLAWGKVPIGERSFRLLLAVFWVGFLLKAGGLFYPFSVAIDLRWHLQRAAEIVDGRLAELYRPGAFSESVMPEEWGTEKPLIPYSPFYHLTAALFFFLPWRPYDTANVLSVLLDLSRPFLLYFLARRLGLDERTGVWAGLLYALFPATFLLHSWGNVPTTTGLWWTLAATCYLVGAWERLRHPRTWAGLVFFLLGAFLYYTVAAVFLVVFLGLLLLGLAVGRGGRPRPLGAVALALLVALGLATAIYYGQYIGPIVAETLPRLLESLRQGGTGLGVRPVSWPEYLFQHLLRLSSLSYGLIGPLVLALGSAFLRWPAEEAGAAQEAPRLRRGVLGAWFGTAFLFFLVGFRVDMVDKEIWFVLPAVALCAAVALERLWRWGWAGRLLVIGLLLFLAVASLQTWVFRLSTVTQEWTAHDARIVGGFWPEIGVGPAVIWGATRRVAGGPWPGLRAGCGCSTISGRTALGQGDRGGILFLVAGHPGVGRPDPCPRGGPFPGGPLDEGARRRVRPGLSPPPAHPGGVGRCPLYPERHSPGRLCQNGRRGRSQGAGQPGREKTLAAGHRAERGGAHEPPPGPAPFYRGGGLWV